MTPFVSIGNNQLSRSIEASSSRSRIEQTVKRHVFGLISSRPRLSDNSACGLPLKHELSQAAPRNARAVDQEDERWSADADLVNEAGQISRVRQTIGGSKKFPAAPNEKVVRP
jgi:hypothetical protein